MIRMTTCPVLYKIRYNGCTGTEEIECGLAYCDGTYANAMEKIEEYYGDDIIEILYLFVGGDGPLQLSEVQMNAFRDQLM